MCAYDLYLILVKPKPACYLCLKHCAAREHDFFAQQFFDVDALVLRFWVIAVEYNTPLIAHWDVDKIVLCYLGRFCQDSDVYDAHVYLIAYIIGESIIDIESDFWKLISKPFNALRHKICRGGLYTANADSSAFKAALLSKFLLALIHEADNILGALNQHESTFCECDTAFFAFKQRRSNLLLKLHYLSAERGLRHVQSIGSSGKVAFMRDHEKIFKRSYLHSLSPAHMKIA